VTGSYYAFFTLEVSTAQAISNAFFIIGLMMFLISLIIITDAGKIFMILSYSFKSFKRDPDMKHKTYYDYMKDREREEMTPYAFQLLIIGAIYLGIAFYFSQLALNR
jgi:hypothetical protein